MSLDYYAQFKGRSWLKKRAILKSLTVGASQQSCMRFYVHMSGKKAGRLIVRESSGAELLRLTGSQGQYWVDHAIALPAGREFSVSKNKQLQNKQLGLHNHHHHPGVLIAGKVRAQQTNFLSGSKPTTSLTFC